MSNDRYEDEHDYEDETDGLPNPYAVPEVEDLLEEAIEILAEARPLPMSNTVKVNRDELLHLLERAQELLPEELRAARWLLKERDDFVAKARQEHQDLIDEGRAQVGRMVERQEIVKAAEVRARQIVSEAKEDANNLKRQVEDYCDQRLASFEMVLNRTVGTVRKGRERLMATAKATTDEIMHGTGSHGVGSHHDDDIDLTGANGHPSAYRNELVDEER
jgi:cell division septum initiation protein DivIVA